MCNHERLLDYLYDELPPGERATFDVHLRECPECRAELSALGGTRLALTAWSPPDSELGFKIVRQRPPADRASRFFGALSFQPAWAFAAAAILVLAVAAAISHLEVRYGNDGLVVRTGWNRAPDPRSTDASSTSVVPASFTPEEWTIRLKSLDERLKQVEQQNRRVQAAAIPNETPSAAPRMSDAQLLDSVRRVIADSEARQQRELAMRLTQVVRDFDATRAGDLARIEQTLRQVQGVTDAELIRHRDTLSHLWRVTQQR